METINMNVLNLIHSRINFNLLQQIVKQTWNETNCRQTYKHKVAQQYLKSIAKTDDRLKIPNKIQIKII